MGLIWNIEDCASPCASSALHGNFQSDFINFPLQHLLICPLDNAPESWSPTTEWEAKLKAIIWSLEDDSPRFRHQQWQRVFDSRLKSTPLTIQAADPLFSLPLGYESEKFTYWLSKEAIWARFHTLSHIVVLEGEQLEVSFRAQSWIP